MWDNLLAQVSKKVTRYKMNWVPEFCYWSFHSHSFSWRSNICSHSSPQSYSYFSQHTTVSNSYLSWFTLRVKYHQPLKFSCFTVFIKIRDLLTVLNVYEVLFVQTLKFYFETHFMDANKIWYRKSPLKLCTLHFSLNLFSRTSNIHMVMFCVSNKC